MSGEFTNERFPKSALYAAGALIAISIVTVGSIRLGVLPVPETAPQSRERRPTEEDLWRYPQAQAPPQAQSCLTPVYLQIIQVS